MVFTHCLPKIVNEKHESFRKSIVKAFEHEGCSVVCKWDRAFPHYWIVNVTVGNNSIDVEPIFDVYDFGPGIQVFVNGTASGRKIWFPKYATGRPNLKKAAKQIKTWLSLGKPLPWESMWTHKIKSSSQSHETHANAFLAQKP